MASALLRLMLASPFRGKLRGPEDAISIEVGNSLRAWTLEGRLIWTWTCIPHEVGFFARRDMARVSQQRYAKAIAQGLIAGSGDYVFVGPGDGGWIELKSATGKLSPDQRDFRDWCEERGVRWARARSLEEFEAILIEWGALKL